MIEYTIKVQRILLSQSQVLVYLTPVNAEGLEPLRHVVHIPKDKFTHFAKMSANEILQDVRDEIVKHSHIFQHKWEMQQAAIDAALPESVFSAEGREFPVVTADEQTAVIPEPVALAEPQEVII